LIAAESGRGTVVLSYIRRVVGKNQGHKNKQVQQANAAKRKPKKRAGSGANVGLFSWVAIGVVVAVILAIVAIKISQSSPKTGNAKGWSVTSPLVASEVTGVPSSVFDTVGISSPVADIVSPQVLTGQPELTVTQGAKKLPEIFYLGAEYCPYCAAQRWSTIVALSRFGKWSGLGDTSSGTLDRYPGTPTFTFRKATYSSKYLVFRSVEEYTNQYDAATKFYKPLQTPSAVEKALYNKYDTSKYVKGMEASNDGAIPFITIANRFLISGASYSPQTLAGATRSQIAAALSNATDPISEAIIASANYQSAAICTVTGQQPSNVCTSKGVKQAAKAMGIK
jgi:hypothetical protein